MGLRILTDTDGYQCLYCSTTMVAFGPVHINSDYELEDFIEYAEDRGHKLRLMDQESLYNLYYKWINSLNEDVDSALLDDAQPENFQ